MNSTLKKWLILLSVIGVLLLAFVIWYKATYAMEKAENQSINDPALATKVLIASQGSEFKNSIVTNITNFYKKDSVYIKVIDIEQLPEENPDRYNAIVVLHTWEYGMPPKAVEMYVTENPKAKDMLIVYATSGSGTSKIEGIDAIAGESILENASDASEEIISRIQKLIHP